MRIAIPALLILTLAATRPAAAQPAPPDERVRPAARPAPAPAPAPAPSPAPSVKPEPPRPVADPSPALSPASKAAPKEKHFDWKLGFDLAGFYSAQGTYIKDLANLHQSLLPGSANLFRERITNTGYFTHHLRFEPRLSVGKWVTLHMRLDGLQNII
jgi:hypothetical protein